MSTDPFSDVTLTPQEIGQATFIELIYTKRRRGKTKRPPQPNVPESLPYLAYGLPDPIAIVDPQEVMRVTAIPQHTYSVSADGLINQSLRSNRVASQLRAMLKNEFVKQACDLPTVDLTCPVSGPSTCSLDVACAVDVSNSNAANLDFMKSLLTELSGQLPTITNNNYRFALQTFYYAIGAGANCKTVTCNLAPVSIINPIQTTLTTVLSGINQSINLVFVPNYVPMAGPTPLSAPRGMWRWRGSIPLGVNGTARLAEIVVYPSDLREVFPAGVPCFWAGYLIFGNDNYAGFGMSANDLDSFNLIISASSSGENDTVSFGANNLLCATSGEANGDVSPLSGQNGLELTYGEFNDTQCAEWDGAGTIASDIDKLMAYTLTDTAYSNSNEVLAAALDGRFGSWRTTAIKILVIMTDASSVGSTGTAFATLVDQAVECGVRIFGVSTNNQTNQELFDAATATDGDYIIVTPSTTAEQLATLMANRFSTICTGGDDGGGGSSSNGSGGGEGSCGQGSSSVYESDFSESIAGWRTSTRASLDPDDADYFGTLIAPETNSLYWDSTLEAVIAAFTNGDGRVRYVVSLLPNTQYSLTFTIVAKDTDCQFQIQVLRPDTSQAEGFVAIFVAIGYGAVYDGSSLPPPRTQTFTFTTPDGVAGLGAIEFRTADDNVGIQTPNFVKVKDVKLCRLGANCGTGYSLISFADFSDNSGGWQGGTVSNGLMLTSSPIIRAFSDLTPNATVRFTFNVPTTILGTITVTMQSGASVEQQTVSANAGTKTFTQIIGAGGDLLITIVANSLDTISLDNFLVCQGDIVPCDGSVTNLKTYLEWMGIPRQPTNIFNMFVRYTFRDPNNPALTTIMNVLPTSEGRLSVAAPVNCNSAGTCDFWKQQGNSGTSPVSGLGLTPNIVNGITVGTISSVAAKTNWLWSIPGGQNGQIQDNLVTIWPDVPPGVVQSIEVFMLVNNILLTNSPTPNCAGPYTGCSPDPAQLLRVIINYTNSQGLTKEFSTTVSKNATHQDVGTSTTWDAITALGNGVRGSNAKWVVATFNLDTVAGDGLDQCTLPLDVSISGTGNLDFGQFTMAGNGRCFPPCIGEVTVEEVQAGSSINEKQSITLGFVPDTWELTVTVREETETITIPNGVTEAQLETLLGAIEFIGPSNVSVTGTGVNGDPFIVEFINLLGGIDVEMMVAEGTNMTDGAIEIEEVQKGGGESEVQHITIIRAQGGSYRLMLRDGTNLYTTSAIPWNAEEDSIAAALMEFDIFNVYEDDVTVVPGRLGSNPDAIAAFDVSFHPRFGNLELMTADTDGLTCVPVNLAFVPAPPYAYDLPIEFDINKCFTLEETTSTPGPLRDSANQYNEITFERDLFDPNFKKPNTERLTVKDLALLKNLSPALYNAYTRNITTGALNAVDYAATVTSKMSVVLIEAVLDTTRTRSRLQQQLQTSKGILPSRSVW